MKLILCEQNYIKIKQDLPLIQHPKTAILTVSVLL